MSAKKLTNDELLKNVTRDLDEAACEAFLDVLEEMNSDFLPGAEKIIEKQIKRIKGWRKRALLKSDVDYSHQLTEEEKLWLTDFLLAEQEYFFTSNHGFSDEEKRRRWNEKYKQRYDFCNGKNYRISEDYLLEAEEQLQSDPEEAIIQILDYLKSKK